jgi:hypothetical protein
MHPSFAMAPEIALPTITAVEMEWCVELLLATVTLKNNVLTASALRTVRNPPPMFAVPLVAAVTLRKHAMDPLTTAQQTGLKLLGQSAVTQPGSVTLRKDAPGRARTARQTV